MASAQDVVTTFIQTLERKDIDAAVMLLSSDVSYDNMPMQPIVGRAAVRVALGSFLNAATRVEWVVSRTVAADNAVVNERVDRFEINGKWLELPVAGVFEVNGDGLITLWRDYFDLGSYTQQMADVMGQGSAADG